MGRDTTGVMARTADLLARASSALYRGTMVVRARRRVTRFIAANAEPVEELLWPYRLERRRLKHKAEAALAGFTVRRDLTGFHRYSLRAAVYVFVVFAPNNAILQGYKTEQEAWEGAWLLLQQRLDLNGRP